MKKIILFLMTSFTLILSSYDRSKSKNFIGPINNVRSDTSEIKALVEKYKQAIDDADTALASKIWAHTGEVSFIHPRGHEHGWEEVKKNIYQFFGDYFSKRQLNISREKIAAYNEIAWVEFYWVFEAIFKKEAAH